MPGKVIIKTVRIGKNKGQLRFVLKGDNGKNLSPQDTYHNRKDLNKTLGKYFSGFEVVDESKKNRPGYPVMP